MNNLPEYREKFKNTNKEKVEGFVEINDFLGKKNMKKNLEIDGFPRIGQKMKYGDGKMGFFDPSTGQRKNKYYKD